MTYCGGDGEWLSLSQCTARWRYQLHADRLAAEVAAGKSCGPDCHGSHKVWRIIDEKEKTAREALRQRLAETAATLEADDTASFWEERMGIDGV